MNHKFNTLWERTIREIPKSKIMLRGQSKLLGALFWILRNILRIKTDFTRFTTTLARTIYVPNDFWDRDDEYQYSTLRHELEHLRQFRSWPFKALAKPGWWWINCFIMGFIYLFLLPVWWTFRAKFEREGYTQTLLVEYELGRLRSAVDQAWWVNWMVSTFTGGNYFYMDDEKTARKWAEATIADIVAGKIKNDRDRIDW